MFNLLVLLFNLIEIVLNFLVSLTTLYKLSCFPFNWYLLVTGLLWASPEQLIFNVIMVTLSRERPLVP